MRKMSMSSIHQSVKKSRSEKFPYFFWHLPNLKKPLFLFLCVFCNVRTIRSFFFQFSKHVGGYAISWPYLSSLSVFSILKHVCVLDPIYSANVKKPLQFFFKVTFIKLRAKYHLSLKIDFLSAEARLEFVGNKYRENYNHLLNQPYGIYLANRLHFKFRREKWPELWKNLISSRPVVAFPWQMGKDCSLGWNVNSVSITPEKKEKKRRKNLRWIKTMTMYINS